MLVIGFEVGLQYLVKKGTERQQNEEEER